MRLAVISDLHITERPCRSDVSLEEQAKILEAIRHDIPTDVSAVLIGGDLYDGKTTDRERDVVWSWLSEMEGKVEDIMIVRGNHDPTIDIAMLNYLDGVIACCEPMVYDYKFEGGPMVGLLPWPMRKVENGAALLADVVRGLVAQKPDIILGHVDLVAAQLDGGQESTGKVSSVLTAADFGDVPTFLGHYHKRQHVSGNVWYVGGIRQMKFGDDTNKGFGVYDTETREWQWFGPYGRRLVTIDWKREYHSAESDVSGVRNGDLIRYRYKVSEADRESVRTQVEEWAKRQPFEIIIEPTVIADTRTRGSEVVEAVTDWDKLCAYWGDQPPARKDEIKAKMEAIR